MKTLRKRSFLFVASLCIVGTFGKAHGQIVADWHVQVDQGNSSDQNWNTVASTSGWYDAPTGGNQAIAMLSTATYQVNASKGVRVWNGSDTFAGGTLILAGGKLVLKNTTSIASVAGLITRNGATITSAENRIQDISVGSLTVETGITRFVASGASNRGFRLAVTTLSGAGTIDFTEGGIFDMEIANASGFEGNLSLSSGTLRFSSNLTTAGSLSIGAGGIVNLTHALSVTGLTVAGSWFAEGTYTHADLDAAGFGAYFTDGGGTLTVGEPGSGQEPTPLPHYAGLQLVRDTVITTSGMNFSSGSWGTCMNGQTFQQEGLVTFNGYQYAAFWHNSGSLGVGRRALPDGAWETIVFDDYSINHNDAHNVNVVGVCPEDGTVHLSFNHHNSVLRYRRSVPGLATNPGSFAWTPGNFGPTTSELAPDVPITPDVTYPLFFTSPEGKLQFVFRLGGSGSGDWHFYQYGASGWEYFGMLFSRLGSYEGKGRRCAYPNQFRYGPDGRLHVTWSWREDGTSLMGNHDLGYAYSEDFGRTWKNNAGDVMVTLDGTDDSENAIKVHTPGNIVFPIRYNWGYMNTTTQTVDSRGRVHVVAWRLPDDGARSDPVDFNDWRYFHYWRDTDGTWTETQLPFHGRKPQVVVDDLGKLHVVFGEGDDLNYHGFDPGAQLAIATATEASGWADWTVASNVTGRVYHGEPLLDMARWYEEGVLSVYYQEKPGSAGSGSPLRALDFLPVEPVSERAQWDLEQFGESAGDPAISGDWRTPAGDGIPNLLKYAFGMTALAPGETELLPVEGEVEIAGERYLAITFRRRASAGSGISYVVLGSDDLVEWAPVDIATNQVGVPEDIGDGFEILAVRMPVPLNSRRSYFLRVQVINHGP